jgi:putative heme-binding domain-containing protein
MEGCLNRLGMLLLAALLAVPATSRRVAADEAEWIWLPEVAKEAVSPDSTAHFRKRINLKVPGQGRVTIAADDAYELFVNGRRIGTGRSYRKMDQYDVSPFLNVGRNVVAIKVANQRGNTAAVAARVDILPEGSERWYTFSTDGSWRASANAPSLWQTATFNDRSWGRAQSFGQLGNTVPWDRREDVAVETEHQESERFQIQSGFSVQRILDDEATGSLIAMAFNEFGHIIASRERGPLLLIFDRDEDGIPEEVRTYCDRIEGVQGILPLNGEIFVTGVGDEGPGIYRLSDRDRNGTLERARCIVPLQGSPGEHGAHGLKLGPDGMIYCVIGNHMQATASESDGTTLTRYYEGDLVPRYEDPGGHARGIKAPGGTVIRFDIEGETVERLAGGLRNAYDLMFHPDGGLFVHDSDMESDVGAAWYRPTALFEIAEGGEYGWRSGWSKWPNYYADRIAPVLETGRGSPAGGAVYEHFMFPVRYHNTLFLADWSEGRILSVRLQRQGGTFKADSEVFLQGQPLNVTDLSVGPDGALYFCTGGRGTSGGIYRVVYDKPIPERVKQLGSGVAAAIRQPQLDAAWSRQKLASLKAELGDRWGELVAGVAYSDENPPHYRTRAMDLMQLFGPAPSDDLLIDLSHASNERVRGKAAQLMGLHPSRRGGKRLAEMLADSDPRVRRLACEAMLRSNQLPEPAALFDLLEEEDRSVRFAARRLLEQIPTQQWRDEVLASDRPTVAILGSMALVIADPGQATALEVLAKMSQMMPTFLSDSEFIDLLRTVELALALGEVKPGEVRPLALQIAEEFPAGEARMNRELIRLAAYLGSDTLGHRALEYLESDAPLQERLHVAMYLRFLDYDWSPEQQFKLLKFYETAALSEAGSSVPLYVMHVTRDFGRRVLVEEDARTILAQGTAWPNAALAALYKLPQPVDEATAAELRQLDEEITASEEATGDVFRRLSTGITAMLASSGDDESLAYLRKVWRENPERRQTVAMALSLHPEGDNWDYLVRSLNVLEGAAATEVINQLAQVQIATDDPEALRQVILQGLKAEQEGASVQPALRLLSHWTGIRDPGGKSPELTTWQRWYAESFPDRPAAELPSGDAESRWDLEQLITYMTSETGRSGDPLEGRRVFKQAQCINCHRFGDVGDAVGPDLTHIARRFTKREVLESILYPSHVISDQYMNRRVLMLDGRVYVGLVSETGRDQLTIRNANNRVATVEMADVDQILPSTSSIMPANLLDELSLQEISDLMAYMGVLPPLEVAAEAKETTR